MTEQGFVAGVGLGRLERAFQPRDFRLQLGDLPIPFIMPGRNRHDRSSMAHERRSDNRRRRALCSAKGCARRKENAREAT